MVRKLIYAVALMFLASTFILAQDDPDRKPEEKKEKEKPITFSVLEITKSPKDITLMVLEDSKVDGKKKELEKAYTDAMDRWNKARAAAGEKKEAFKDAKPEKTSLKVLTKGLTKADAEAFRAKTEESMKKRLEKKTHEVKKGQRPMKKDRPNKKEEPKDDEG